MSEPAPLPDGFVVGHATLAGTGCTVVIPPDGARGAVEVRGGGTGTRELEALAPLANAEGPTAVLFTGGSAFGLGVADGVVMWLEERGRGRETPAGIVPAVPTAVIFDLEQGKARPRAQDGYEACDRATGGVPERGAVGAGTGAAVGKALGRERATGGGVGYAAAPAADGTTVAALVVANSVGDVIGPDGEVIGGPHGETGEMLRGAELIARLSPGGDWPITPGVSTTLVCVCTDSALDKRDCGIVARMATSGLARAVDPAFSPFDGDVLFCLASGAEPAPPSLSKSLLLLALGTIAATVTAEAIRDAVNSSAES